MSHIELGLEFKVYRIIFKSFSDLALYLQCALDLHKLFGKSHYFLTAAHSFNFIHSSVSISKKLIADICIIGIKRISEASPYIQITVVYRYLFFQKSLIMLYCRQYILIIVIPAYYKHKFITALSGDKIHSSCFTVVS